jgi:hypothetical protein
MRSDFVLTESGFVWTVRPNAITFRVIEQNCVMAIFPKLTYITKFLLLYILRVRLCVQ